MLQPLCFARTRPGPCSHRACLPRHPESVSAERERETCLGLCRQASGPKLKTMERERDVRLCWDEFFDFALFNVVISTLVAVPRRENVHGALTLGWWRAPFVVAQACVGGWRNCRQDAKHTLVVFPLPPPPPSGARLPAGPMSRRYDPAKAQAQVGSSSAPAGGLAALEARINERKRKRLDDSLHQQLAPPPLTAAPGERPL